MATYEAAASRRINRIADHLQASQAASCPPNLSPLVCSNRLSSSRKDARVMFGRQIHHLSHYSSGTIDSEVVPKAADYKSAIQPGARRSNRLLYARQSTHISEPDTKKSMVPQEIVNEESSTSQPAQRKIEESCREEKPRFGRPTNYKQAKELSLNEPLFARNAQPKLGSEIEGSESKDSKWIPRMDVTESRLAYIVVVELPGVNADEIRVEINNDRLLVYGARGNAKSRGHHTSYEQREDYLQKELPQGPYGVSWVIPKDSETRLISAELIDGFLKILVPKVMF